MKPGDAFLKDREAWLAISGETFALALGYSRERLNFCAASLRNGTIKMFDRAEFVEPLKDARLLAEDP